MLEIRDMTQEDREIFLTMAKDFYSGDATLFPVTRAMLEDTLAESLRPEKRVRLLMLVDDGESVGYGNLTFSYSTEAGGMVCWLEEIYLAPQARNRGLGGEYLAWVLKEYEDTVKRFRLEVCPANPEARRLYERYGFHKLSYQQMMR